MAKVETKDSGLVKKIQKILLDDADFLRLPAPIILAMSGTISIALNVNDA